MICALSISDFVLIDRLDLDAGPGLVGLTGETGAGKSILLDAIGLAIGLKPEKRFVRPGASRAVVSVTFDIAADHPVWGRMEAAGLDGCADDALILKRIVPVRGAARSFVNDQPVAAALLAEIGQELVEVHGQHAAAGLARPSRHRDLLDQFAGTNALLADHKTAFLALQSTRAARQSLERAIADSEAHKDILEHNIAELQALSPEPGEANRLAAARLAAQAAARINLGLSEIEEALGGGTVSGALGRAARAADQISQVNKLPQGLSDKVSELSATLERASIEVVEADASLAALTAQATVDEPALEAAEARLFALRAAARKHQVDVDALPARLVALEDEMAALERGDAGLQKAIAMETAAAARWRSAAARLTEARRAAARRLENAVHRELKPLKLGSVKCRVGVQPLAEEDVDPRGADRVEIEVETNPGGGFGPLRTIASGGELARMSLALACASAAASTGSATLIFDEADQGVGGAVAHAIGTRLKSLSGHHQVFAITHSPQVAAAADIHWRIAKSAGRRRLGQTTAHVLDAKGRTEEIARMLSGAEVTEEARAAAVRLLER
ncbi:MAG: AAA family ATPase [Pseudomonadota bacterium]